MAKYAKYIVDKWIELGGSLTSEEEKKRRLSICDKCEHKGTVYPIPGESYPGCTKCGCILEAKASAETLFNFKKMRVERSTCPLKKWEL